MVKFILNESQFNSLKLAMEFLRKVKISEINTDNPKGCEKAAGAIFAASGCLYTVINQVEGEG